MTKGKDSKIVQVPMDEYLLKRIDETAGVVAKVALHSFATPAGSV